MGFCALVKGFVFDLKRTVTYFPKQKGRREPLAQREYMTVWEGQARQMGIKQNLSAQIMCMYF